MFILSNSDAGINFILHYMKYICEVNRIRIYENKIKNVKRFSNIEIYKS